MADTSSSDPLFQRAISIFESLNAESDRGCVLVIGSMVERALEKQISKRLCKSASSEDDLMGKSSSKPISGFSAKINLGYRIGLFPLRERKIFHQLRELRNTCAHDIDRQEFDANHFKDRVKNMIEESDQLWETMKNKIGDKLFSSDPPTNVMAFIEKVGWRTAFALFFALIVAHKETTLDRVLPITPLY